MGISLDADHLSRSHLRFAEMGVSLEVESWCRAQLRLPEMDVALDPRYADLRLDTVTKQRANAASCLADLFVLVGSLSSQMVADTMRRVFDGFLAVEAALYTGQQISGQSVLSQTHLKLLTTSYPD